jgi:hypothetical protein
MEQRSDSSRRRAHPSAPAQTSQTEGAGHASKPLRIAGYGPSSRPRSQQNAPKGADTRSTRTSPKCRWGTDATEAEPSPGSSIHVAGLGIEADGMVLTNVRVLLTRTLRGNSVTRRRASVPECRTHGSNLCAVILAEGDVRGGHVGCVPQLCLQPDGISLAQGSLPQCPLGVSPLVENLPHLAKMKVAGSSPVVRSPSPARPLEERPVQGTYQRHARCQVPFR